MTPYSDEELEAIEANGLPGFPKLTDEQAYELIQYANRCGDSRKATQERDMSEVDYIAGCMAFLQALGLWGKLPAGWVLLPLAGDQVFNPKLNGPTRLDEAKARIIALEERLWAYEEEYGDIEVPDHVASNAEMHTRAKRIGLSEKGENPGMDREQFERLASYFGGKAESHD